MKPYEPEHLPIRDLDISRLFKPTAEASTALAHYDGLLRSLVNPAVLLSPLTNEEAVLSSRIEGTQATVEEVLEHEAGQRYPDEIENDIQEILNYRKGLLLASKELEERPIRLPLIRELHRLLMTSVRGEDKTPGEFRTDQNWIGPRGCPMEEATFVPPDPIHLEKHLRDWEDYLGHEDIDPIVQAGVVHAQFELLHPFRDGNGRIGRLLIPLFLYRNNRLTEPMFYISAYLERHRDEYYARLQAISEQRDWTGWLVFFINAVTDQARANTKRVEDIRALYEETKTNVVELTGSKYATTLVDALFRRPIFRTSHVEEAGIPHASIYPLIHQLVENDLIKTVRQPAGRRPAIYAFPRLLNIAEGREVFA